IMAVSLKLMLLVALAVAISACGNRETPSTPPVPAEAAPPVPASKPDSEPGVPASKPDSEKDTRPVIAAFGDSLSAGFGVEPGKSYPDDLQRLLDAAGFQYHVV